MSIYQLRLAALDVAAAAATANLRLAFRRAALEAELAPTGIPLAKLLQVVRREGAPAARAAGRLERCALGLGDRT